MDECKPLDLGFVQPTPIQQECLQPAVKGRCDIIGRGLHSSTFQLNLSRFGHTYPCPPV